MNTDKVKYIIEIIKNVLGQNIKDSDIFDQVAGKINDCGNRLGGSNFATVADCMGTDKKNKGDLWEAFCYLYMMNILKHDTVWMYKDIPADIKNMLHLPAKDYGIDIVSVQNNKYYAIQCKFKNPASKTPIVPWDSLATFYAIVTKTGPWEKHITMTNMRGCRHIGEKTAKDYSICIGTYKNLSRFDWLNLAGIGEEFVVDQPAQISAEEMRQKRIELLDKK